MWGKSAKWSSQKAVQRKAPSALVKDQKDMHKSAFRAFKAVCAEQCLKTVAKIIMLVNQLIGVYCGS